jgi:hypothetical protein
MCEAGERDLPVAETAGFAVEILSGWNQFACGLAERINNSAGHFQAFTPVGERADYLRFREQWWPGPGASDEAREWVARRFSEISAARDDLLVVVNDWVTRKTDTRQSPWLHVRSEGQVFYLITQPDRQRNTLCEILEDSSFLPVTFAALTNKEKLVPVQHGHDIDPAALFQAGVKAEAIAIEAYDAASYLMWFPTGG